MSVPIYATSPLPWAVLGVVILAVLWRHLPPWLGMAIIAIEVLLVVSMMPVGANLLARWVESRAPPSGTCEGPQPAAIVVLAGGYDHAPHDPDDYGSMRIVTLQRVFAGVALWRDQPDTRLVLSGGGGEIPEAIVMAHLAVRLGVPAATLEIEDRSRNTWENARDVAALAPAVPRHIWLVTSPMHLPRALVAFHAWGFDPCPWSAGPIQAMPAFSFSQVVPQSESLRKAAYALHELIGGVEYAVLAQRQARREATPQTP